MVIECKNATRDEAIALGIDQVRRYHDETPEMFVPQQIFTATESIGFSYGVTWNTIRRNIFNWKDREIGNLEAKVKSFCSIENILGYLKHYIMFAEKDEELNKYILHQHQRTAAEKVIERAHHKSKRRGLVWHTQGSGKTFTMIKTVEILFKAPESDKPTILLMIDRNELEDQMMKNLDSVGMNNVARAVNTKNFLKGKKRIEKIAEYVAQHFQENINPMGYKAFLVGVDREACALYKKALDKYLPPEFSEVVYTGNNNDSRLLKEFHHDTKKERAIRKSFAKFRELPKILIVTEKLLTGYDAPLLYAMYLDKPMRDHTLLQAIARVNRPYENEEQDMVKPHGFVLDFVGIFEKLEKALAFDSDEIKAVVKDINLLKTLFKNKMEDKAPQYLSLIEHNFNDKDTDNLIEHFRDKDKRKEFFKEYKEIEMLYEIISPDKFLRTFIDDYRTLFRYLRYCSEFLCKKGVCRQRISEEDQRFGKELCKHL